MVRYDQCDATCTVDCGHCKGQGRPAYLSGPPDPPSRSTRASSPLHTPRATSRRAPARPTAPAPTLTASPAGVCLPAHCPAREAAADLVRSLAGVREHVTHAAAQYGINITEVDTTDQPAVRFHIPDPGWRRALAPVVIDGPVVREVYLDGHTRVEHLSGPSRFDRSVSVALYGDAL